jgi:hypothetical protein
MLAATLRDVTSSCEPVVARAVAATTGGRGRQSGDNSRIRWPNNCSAAAVEYFVASITIIFSIRRCNAPLIFDAEVRVSG